jgi:branched-chain amino acid transport system permease protein
MSAVVAARRGREPLFTFREGTTQHRLYQVVGWAFFVVPVFVLPYILPSFRVSQLAQCAAWAVAILGMNMVIGWSGLISLGHIAFVGLGAYTTMILMNYDRFDMWMTLPVAFVLCFVFGFLVGLPALKIKGLYLALVTLALAYTFPILLKIDQGGIAKHTGGDNGRTLTEKMVPTSWIKSLLNLNGKDGPTQVAIYKYFSLVLIAAVCFLLMRNILKSRPGRAMIALRDNPIGAAVSGVPLTRQKLLTFALSAAFAGIGGSMMAAVLDSVGPTTFGFTYAILTLMGLVLAGVGTLHGCWLGGLFVVFLQDFAPRWVKDVPFVDLKVIYAGAIYGLVLVLVPFLMPRGIVSFARTIKGRLVRVIPAIPRRVEEQVPGLAPTPARAELGTTVGLGQ